MNRLMLAAAATALCAAATTFTAPAEAGMRFGGGGFRFHHFAFRRHHYTPPAYRYSAEEDDEVRVRRKSVRKPAQAAKPEPEKKVPLVKFADGTGRQYDPASKVWFDGKSQCYSGTQAFTFKSDTWFYGSSRWALSNGSWQSASNEQPELVSCDSVAKFAAKANATAQSEQTQAAGSAQGGNAATPVQRTTDKPANPPQGQTAKIKTAEGEAATQAAKPATQSGPECKKYFPSVGQMLTVPCGE
jgi:hypothetical protein